MSGNSARKSAESCSTTASPQRAASCCSVMTRPIFQYRHTSSRLTLSSARRLDWAIRLFMSAKTSEYPVGTCALVLTAVAAIFELGLFLRGARGVLVRALLMTCFLDSWMVLCAGPVDHTCPPASLSPP